MSLQKHTSLSVNSFAYWQTPPLLAELQSELVEHTFKNALMDWESDWDPLCWGRAKLSEIYKTFCKLLVEDIKS